jgi:hypothetical protein
MSWDRSVSTVTSSQSLTSNENIKNVWSYMSTPLYFSMPWCLIKRGLPFGSQFLLSVCIHSFDIESYYSNMKGICSVLDCAIHLPFILSTSDNSLCEIFAYVFCFSIELHKSFQHAGRDPIRSWITVVHAGHFQ